MSRIRGISLYFLMFLLLLSQSAYADRLVYYAQKRLNQQGYKAGLADGVWGRKTKNALLRFQKDLGLSTTGRIDDETRKKLGLKVIGKSQIGSASLYFLSSPIIEMDEVDLLAMVKKLNVIYDGSRDLVLREVAGTPIHTGHVTALLKDECVYPYEIGLGELVISGRSMRAANYGEIFTADVERVMNKVHSSVSDQIIKHSNKDILLICTAAMF